MNSKEEMSFSEWFTQKSEEYKDDPDCLLEEVLIHVTDAICVEMERQGISKSDLAKKMEKPPSWLSRILGSDHNMTFRSAVLIFQALGCRMRIGLEPLYEQDPHQKVVTIQPAKNDFSSSISHDMNAKKA
ncbi:MAG: hypothetical protein GC154_18545 [bacterium]|nr:hypothetical protein [bacterium]